MISKPFYRNILILLVFLYSFSFNFVSAQNISMDKTIEYLNHKFSNKCNFSVKNTKLIVEFTNNNVAFRDDQVFLSYLDIKSIRYLPEEKSIILKCGEEREECIQRKIYRNKIIRAYNRINFAVDHMDEKSIKGCINAFKHLINLVQNPNKK